MPKTARQKLDICHPSHGRAFPILAAMRKRLGGAASMVVPRPIHVEALMRTPRKGGLITLGRIRATLASRARAETCCPLTTGIFARLAAEAAEDDRAAGRKRFTPWWRTIRDNGQLIDKFPGGKRRGAMQARLLRAEGHALTRSKGNSPPRIADFSTRSASAAR